MTAVPRRIDVVMEAAPPDCLRKTVDLTQAKTGALTGLLGGEERFEDPRQYFRRDAGSGIGDADGDEFAAQALFRAAAAHQDRLGGDGKRAAGRHGIARIDGKVEQSELELIRVDLDRA